MDIKRYIERQREWSAKTFGTDQRTEGICKHIAKELEEIRAKPNDVIEWIDVIILAIDGAWRAGHTPEEIIAAMQTKQYINFSREYLVTPPDQPSEHIRKE